MPSYLAGLASDTAPGLALVAIALAAAIPPYLITSHSTRGRARSAIGYLLGLGAGLIATVLLAAVAGAGTDIEAMALAGLAAAFFAPFAGLARGKWQARRRPVRRKTVPAGFSH
jgi:hypothetical protein